MLAQACSGICEKCSDIMVLSTTYIKLKSRLVCQSLSVSLSVHVSRNPHTLYGHLDVLLEYILNNVKQARNYDRYT